MDYKYKENLDKNIFRGYDIRGVYPTNLDEDTAYTFGLGFGTHIKRLGKDKCVVGHDNRLSSPSLYKALIDGITSTGVDVVCLGLCTTPMYYYACIKLGIPSGVMVTASHNPKDDNGLKFAFDENGNCKGQEIQDFYQELLEKDFIEGSGSTSSYDILPEYIDLYRECISMGDRKIKVVLDPANGATSSFVREIYEQFPNLDLVIINEEEIKLIVTLANQFRLIYQVKTMFKGGYSEFDISKKLDIHPFRIKLANAVCISLDECLEYLKKLSILDEEIKKELKEDKIKMIAIQRSKGYSTRDSISIDKIEKVVKVIREVDKEVIIMVDNCYCELVSTKEPNEVGVDISVGSLIKNLGGAIASNGGYIVGKQNLIDLEIYGC